jgi:hypothetical protein
LIIFSHAGSFLSFYASNFSHKLMRHSLISAASKKIVMMEKPVEDDQVKTKVVGSVF